MIATAGSSKSKALRTAASASTKLLYDISLPCSCVAWAMPGRPPCEA
jgi:hypothetical protein